MGAEFSKNFDKEVKKYGPTFNARAVPWEAGEQELTSELAKFAWVPLNTRKKTTWEGEWRVGGDMAKKLNGESMVFTVARNRDPEADYAETYAKAAAAAEKKANPSAGKQAKKAGKKAAVSAMEEVAGEFIPGADVVIEVIDMIREGKEKVDTAVPRYELMGKKGAPVWAWELQEVAGIEAKLLVDKKPVCATFTAGSGRTGAPAKPAVYKMVLVKGKEGRHNFFRVYACADADEPVSEAGAVLEVAINELEHRWKVWAQGGKKAANLVAYYRKDLYHDEPTKPRLVAVGEGADSALVLAILSAAQAWSELEAKVPKTWGKVLVSGAIGVGVSVGAAAIEGL